MSENSHNKTLIDAIKNNTQNKEIPCADVFAITAKEHVTSLDAGAMLNELDISITKCQLGLFGYGQGDEKKLVRPAESVSDELRAEISSRLIQGRLACAQAWAIADMLQISKLDVASACETLGIKISRCQLGAF